MLSEYVRDFFDFKHGEYATCVTDLGNFDFDSINYEIASNTKHLKIICTPNYFYPKEMTIDKFYNLEILDIADFQISYVCDIIENMKFLNHLKILRLNNCKFLNNDILPDNLEILIINDICSCNDCPQIFNDINNKKINNDCPQIFNDINNKKINFDNIFMLGNVPLYVKQIILNLNHIFVKNLKELGISDYFFQDLTEYLQCIKIPFGCKIVLNGKFI